MKSFEPKIAIVIVLIIGLLQFSACSSSEVNESQSSSTKGSASQVAESENPSMPEATPEVEKDIVPELEPVLPVTITDAVGNTITITSVERIIPLDGSVAEVVFALDLGANVVATDRSATWPPEASELPQIGYQRSLLAEPIAGFTPTVLIGTEIAGPEKTLDDLRRLGYPVVIVPSEATMQGPAEKIRAVAEALGVPNRGEELATEMEKTIVSNTQVFEEDMRPVVAALYIRGTGTQLVLGRDSATHWLINAAGGKNVADILDIDQYKTITAESLLRAEPDILLVPSAGLESVGGVDGLLEVGGISQTPAGINRAVLAYDDQLLLGNGPRTGDLLKQLAADFRNLVSQTSNN
tara:strand:- start:2606 stop:3664 length:1059 start_codon:yes stop_codon:yes gene_type:complete